MGSSRGRTNTRIKKIRVHDLKRSYATKWMFVDELLIRSAPGTNLDVLQTSDPLLWQ